ncbi:hypothetical protein [Streptomyces sp. NPDC049881]|uniref:hypothetical protein n=1 Tax=Streptomyces sp. NPDC049881 TaxID=3155778 RepID=UPI00341D891B
MIQARRTATRGSRRPDPRLAFGFGPHFCVAAQLAKAELRVAVGTLSRRFPAPRLAEADSRLTWRRGRMVRASW